MPDARLKMFKNTEGRAARLFFFKTKDASHVLSGHGYVTCLIPAGRVYHGVQGPARDG